MSEQRSLSFRPLESTERELVARLPLRGEQISEEYLQIPLSDGTTARAKIWRQKRPPDSARPLILLFHGGGFHAGSCEQCTRPGREFAAEFDAVVVSAEYRLSPQYKFPQMQLDGIDIAGWLVENASEHLGSDVSKGFVVGGFSAGANVAAVVASKAREKGICVTGSYLCIPFLFSESNVPAQYSTRWRSHKTNTPEPALGKVDLDAILRSMDADTASPLFCPANNPKVLQDLPRTYIQVGQKDIWRDDGIVYARLLQDSGVDTMLDVSGDLGHQTWSIWQYDDANIARRLQDGSLLAMRWLLSD